MFRTFIAVAIAMALSACGMFHERSDYYAGATETRPLEVPPDLDAPASNNALVVPPVGSGAAAAVASIGNAELQVPDTVQSTWQRVGAALDRADVGTVSGRDENGHAYTLDVTGTMSTRPERERHWYTPVLDHLGFNEDEKKEVSRHVTVQVAENAGGSRVSVSSEGADKFAADSTARVVAALRQSLGVSAPAVAAVPAEPVSSTPPAAEAAPAMASAAAEAPAGAAPAAAPPGMPGVTVAGSELHVADNVDHTWQRVGLALERAQIGSLSARDPAAHTYTLEFDSTVETAPPAREHHWYSRILHPFGGGSGKTEQVKRSLTVRVADDNGAARVSVEADVSDKGTADAARRVMEVLRDRLS
jgi:uncharacterized lipoprotein